MQANRALPETAESSERSLARFINYMMSKYECNMPFLILKLCFLFSKVFQITAHS